MATLPAEFEPHFRKSPVTAPWEPLYSRRRADGVDLAFEVQPPHCNSRGLLHGGVLAALCDNVMGLTLGTALRGEANIVTISLAVDYLDSARVGDLVIIVPRVVRAGASLGFCDALATSGDRPIARANASFSVRIVDANRS
jgi:uncharacterized protein (TIGR00369 family)